VCVCVVAFMPSFLLLSLFLIIWLLMSFKMIIGSVLTLNQQSKLKLRCRLKPIT